MVNLPVPFTSFVATVARFSNNCLQTDPLTSVPSIMAATHLLCRDGCEILQQLLADGPLDLGALDHGSHAPPLSRRLRDSPTTACRRTP